MNKPPERKPDLSKYKVRHHYPDISKEENERRLDGFYRLVAEIFREEITGHKARLRAMLNRPSSME